MSVHTVRPVNFGHTAAGQRPGTEATDEIDSKAETPL